MSETIIVTGPSGATPVQPPPAPPSVLDDAKAVIADLETRGGGDKGSEATPKAPATPTASPATAKTGEPSESAPPSKETAPAKPATATPAAPAKVPYTDEEFAAFDGNYHRRDFDWDRWPEKLKDSKEFVQRVASGYGKRHANLEQQLREQIQQELGAKPQTTPQKTAASGGGDTAAALTPEALNTALDTLLNPEAPVGDRLKGLRSILAAPEGREILSDIGFADPSERAVVSELAQDRIIQKAITNIADDFPLYLEDEGFRKDVSAVFDELPLLTEKVKSRSEDEATLAFVAANGLALSRRLKVMEASLATREKGIADRESALTVKEQGLKEQIEATNRGEPKSPALQPQPAGAPRVSQSIVDDAREILAQVGPIG